MLTSRRKNLLFGLALALFLCFGGVALAEPTDMATEPAPVEVTSTDAEACVVELETQILLPATVLDQVQQENCGCRDLCLSDSQCVLQHGPGAVCQPQGPCGCKECSVAW